MSNHRLSNDDLSSVGNCQQRSVIQYMKHGRRADIADWEPSQCMATPSYHVMIPLPQATNGLIAAGEKFQGGMVIRFEPLILGVSTGVGPNCIDDSHQNKIRSPSMIRSCITARTIDQQRFLSSSSSSQTSDPKAGHLMHQCFQRWVIFTTTCHRK